LHRLQESVAELHRLIDEAKGIIASSREALQVASRFEINSPGWMRARFSWPDAKQKIMEIAE
jgi:hypothetical protein